MCTDDNVNLVKKAREDTLCVLITYCVPDTIIHFFVCQSDHWLITTLLQVRSYLSVFYKWENWSTERINDLPKALQLVNSRAKIERRTACLQSLWSFHYLPSCCSVRQRAALILINPVAWASPFPPWVSGTILRHVNWTLLLKVWPTDHQLHHHLGAC